MEKLTYNKKERKNHLAIGKSKTGLTFIQRQKAKNFRRKIYAFYTKNNLINVVNTI